MGNLNKVFLMGRITRDAELRYLPSGSPVLEMRLATSRKYQNRDGEGREEQLFIDVSLFGRRAEALAQYLKRGTGLLVEGRLKLDEWKDRQTGQNRSKIRVIAENIEFTGGRGGEYARNTEPAAARAPHPQPVPQPAASASAAPHYEPISDEDVPF